MTARSVKIHNDFIEDVYLWVWDLNTVDRRVVLDGARINAGMDQSISVETDQDGYALVEWYARKTQDPNTDKRQENVKIDKHENLNIGPFW